MEELEVVAFHRVDEHEDEAGMLDEAKPEGGSFSQETGAHLFLKLHILVNNGKSRGVLEDEILLANLTRLKSATGLFTWTLSSCSNFSISSHSNASQTVLRQNNELSH